MTLLARCFCMICIIGWIAPITRGDEILTFDELSFRPVDGVTAKDVTFDFKIDGIDSFDAFYGSFGPGELTSIQDPSLVGNSTGILTLDFSAPTDLLEFGVALSTSESLAAGLVVELFDENLSSLGTTTVETVNAEGATAFSEGRFFYSGTPLVRAVIDFAAFMVMIRGLTSPDRSPDHASNS